MTDKNSLGTILRRLRLEKRKKRIEAAQWTQEAVARRLKVSRVTYIAWEKGYSVPDIDNLQRVVEVFRPWHDDEAALYRMVGYLPPSIHNLSTLQNPYFTGRETYLDQIGQLFDKGKKLIVLYGSPGIGKTEIALMYAHRHLSKKYRAVFRMDASDLSTIIAGFDTMAKLLELPEQMDEKPQERMWGVRHWLETHGYWLLIMDNLIEIEYMFTLLPVTPLGHTLVTTRIPVRSEIDTADSISIKALEPEEGLRFLLRFTGMLPASAPLDAVAPDTLEAARRVVEQLGTHPETLFAAAMYMGRKRLSFTDYLLLISNQNDAEESLYIYDNFLHEVGLDALPPKDKAALYLYYHEVLLSRVDKRFDELFTRQQAEEYNRIYSTGNATTIAIWMEINFPNHHEIVDDELAKLKAEVIQVLPRILNPPRPSTDEPSD